MIIGQQIKEPKSTKEKTKLARELYQQFNEIRTTKDVANWFEGKILYYFDKFGLHNYLFGKAMTKKAFYAEIDVPPSTVAFKRDIYEFYIVRHKFTFEDLRKANTKKLHRALTYIREFPKEKVKEIVDLAEREKQSLSDFLINCGAKDKFCVHEETQNKNIKVCKLCGKILTK